MRKRTRPLTLDGQHVDGRLQNVQLFPHRSAELRAVATRSQEVVILAALVGAVTGLVIAGLDWLVAEQLLPHVQGLDHWAMALCPLGGLLVSYAARRWLGAGASPATADEYIRAFHDDQHALPVRAFGARLIASIATVGSGVPMGLEGPSLYAGAAIGSTVQRRLPRSLRPRDYRTLLVAGGAAGVAAIFKAPATGAVFALEVPYQDDLARRMLLPALVASATGYLTFVAFLGTEALFPVADGAGFTIRDLLGAAALGAFAGIAARLFARSLRIAKSLATQPRPLLRTAAVGVLLGAAFVAGRALTGESLLIGPGYEVIRWAAQPKHAVMTIVAILVLRCLATAAAVAGGGTGGIFIPLAAGGALIGALVGNAIGTDDMTLFIVIGVAAFLGAGYRVPLASVMFVAETTGRPSFIVPGLIAAVAGELMMGRSSVTAYQRFPEDPEPTNATTDAAT